MAHHIQKGYLFFYVNHNENPVNFLDFALLCLRFLVISIGVYVCMCVQGHRYYYVNYKVKKLFTHSKYNKEYCKKGSTKVI